MNTCKNCSQVLESRYCPDCGQKASVRRIKTKDLFSDLLNRFLPWNKGFVFTSKKLLTGPGNMVREYLEGKRVNYSKPFQFLLLVLALSLIFYDTQSFANQIGQQNRANEIQAKINSLVFSHMTIVILGMLPFMALFSRLLYRKYKLNYAEHLVFNIYVMAGSTLATLPFNIYSKLAGVEMFNTYLLLAQFGVMFIYYGWAYVQYYRTGHSLWGGIRPIFVYLFAYLSYIIAISILVAIGIMVYFLIFGKAGMEQFVPPH